MNTILSSVFYSKLRESISRFAEVMPAFLPAVVLFLMIPFAIYLPNQSEFNFNAGVIVPYLALFSLWCLLLVFLLPKTSEPVRTRVIAALFYLGIFFLLSDIVAPVQLGELVGGQEQESLKEPLILTAAEAGVALVLLAGAFVIPFKRVSRWAMLLVFLLIISQGLIAAKGFSGETHLFHMTRSLELAPEPSALSQGGNIYHLTFDAYSSHVFMEAVEALDLHDDFKGFYFFKNNRANYVHTALSKVSYMTGTVFEEEGPLKVWRDSANRTGLIKELYEAGYAVSMYAQDYSWRHEKASAITSNHVLMTRYQQGAYLSQFADLWLLRSVPNFLQHEVYSNGEGVFTRLTKQKGIPGGENQRAFSSYLLARQLIDDEASRPGHGQYVYAHVYIPHGPYILDRNCGVAPEEGDYREQAFCATRLVADFISELKRLGRFEKSTILFHSDHATWEISPKNPENSAVPVAGKEEIAAVNLRQMSAEYIDNQTHALFVAKPPGQIVESLVVSERPTQLLDIPATLYDAAGLPNAAFLGSSVFTGEHEQDRERHIFIGYKQKDANGETKVFGKNLQEGEMNHFSYTAGKGWKVYPNMAVKWE